MECESSEKRDGEKNQYIIRFVRKGEMQMPIDFTITSGKETVLYNFYIPNSWFEKKTSATKATTMDRLGKVQPYYDEQVNYSGWN